MPATKGKPSPLCPPMPIIPPRTLVFTEPFTIVYGDVTIEIQNYAPPGSQPYLFMDFIVCSFYHEYLKWDDPTKDWGIATNYLQNWGRNDYGHAYRLVGQAYLHIAWDLPRVIADCYPLTVTDPLSISEADATLHFVLTNRLFRQVFINNFKKYDVAGVFCVVGWLFGSNTLLANTTANWIIALRTTSLALGISLAKQKTPADRQTLEIALGAAVQNAALNAIRTPFSFVRWMAMIMPPFCIIDIGLLGATVSRSHNSLPLAILAAVALISGLIVVCFFLAYRGTINIVETMGQRLNTDLLELLERSRQQQNPE